MPVEPDLERGDSFHPAPLQPNGPKQSKTGVPILTTAKHSATAPVKPLKNRHSTHISFHNHPYPDLDPTTGIPPKLQKFRNVLGVSNSPYLTASSSGAGGGNNPSTPNSKTTPKRPAANLGIYARVVSEERTARWQFYTVASLINACYFLQIVIAAALTSLGASSASHVLVTVFGGLNTVIAGILTYLKGQALPTRLRQYWIGLRKCREYIEEKERELAEPECELDVDRELAMIVRMYHDVRQTAEDNTPDTYLPMKGAGRALLKKSGKERRKAKPPAATVPVAVEEEEGEAEAGAEGQAVAYPEEDVDRVLGKNGAGAGDKGTDGKGGEGNPAPAPAPAPSTAAPAATPAPAPATK
ncbi:MAG: hypothetical protein LQ351_001707 [Letrouitia transgressa]|nr:MAG: hypothetical protein LQ351_001707 [Letrouitia transgressa]